MCHESSCNKCNNKYKIFKSKFHIQKFRQLNPSGFQVCAFNDFKIFNVLYSSRAQFRSHSFSRSCHCYSYPFAVPLLSLLFLSFCCASPVTVIPIILLCLSCHCYSYPFAVPLLSLLFLSFCCASLRFIEYLILFLKQRTF